METKEARRAAFIAALLSKSETPRMSAPQKRAYTDEQAKKLLDGLRAFMAVHSITQTRMAGILNISGSSLSTLMRGEYSGDDEKQLRKIEEFLDRETERAELPSLTRFVETGVAKSIFKVCRQNHVHGTMGAVVGEAGVGKSRAIKEYALRNENVIYLMASTWISNPSQLSRALAMTLVRDMRRVHTMQDRTEAIIDQLAENSRLLVIDQAHQLTQRGHEYMQNLWDHCNPRDDARRLGIVYACTNRFWKDIHSEKSLYWFEQLTSRMDAGTNVRIPPQPYRASDVELICADLKYSPTPAAREKLLSLANTSTAKNDKASGLRSAIANVSKVQDLLTIQKAPATTRITVEHLIDAQGLMLRSAA